MAFKNKIVTPIKEARATVNFVPPTGYVKELARICGCTEATVWNALRKNSPGDKADRVRRVFRAKYMNQGITEQV